MPPPPLLLLLLSLSTTFCTALPFLPVSNLPLLPRGGAYPNVGDYTGNYPTDKAYGGEDNGEYYPDNNSYDNAGYDDTYSPSDGYSPSYTPAPLPQSMLSAVSKTSISGVFFILMWRSVHHYENSDASMSLRLFYVLPSIVLFLANLYGFISSFLPDTSSPTTGTSTKKYLKPILNANKIAEALLFINGVFRLLFIKPKRIYGRPLVTKEQVVGKVLVNAVYIALCQIMTKVSVWGVEGAAGASRDHHQQGQQPEYDQNNSNGGWDQQDNYYDNYDNYDNQQQQY